LLASGVVPAQAGVVGYFFFEGSDGPHPGQAGAVLLFSSPPAESNAGWTLSNIADIADFKILDSSLGPVGVYTPALITPSISSNTGATLDSGQISESLPPTAFLMVAFDSSAGGSLIANLVSGVSSHGDWRVGVSAAVPEPSSLAMAATALSAGVMLWMRRRRRSHGETGPVAINRH
jgi:PEP-CTERM motif